MDHPGKTYPPGPTPKFPHSLLEPCHRFRRQAPLRLLVIPASPVVVCRFRCGVVPGSPASALSGAQTVARRSSRRSLGSPCWPSLVVAPACSFLARRPLPSTARQPDFLLCASPTPIRSLPRRPSGLHPYSPPERPDGTGFSAACRWLSRAAYSSLPLSPCGDRLGLRSLRSCRVGGGAPKRWPPSAAQTARTVFPYAAFTKT
jgi:hypothetical protein